MFYLEMINHYEIQVVFQDTEYQLRQNTLYYFLHYSFFFNFLLHYKYIRSTQSYLREALAKLPYRIKYLDPNMKI